MLSMKTYLHTALLIFLSSFSSTSGAQEADDCAPQKELTWLKATYAQSGDTLIIQNTRVRLNGLYAPQIERQYKFNTPGQPLAQQAKTFLNTLLANNQLEVGVEYDTIQIDRFNRQLVHLFLRDGTNVQQKLLENGYALAHTSHQNTLHQHCYFAAEQYARENRYQLWELADKYPELHYPLVNSTDLQRDDDGFRIIRGKVETVEKSASQYILNLDTTGIRIPKRHWDAFDFDTLKALRGQVIEVRGQAFFYQGAMYVTAEHPNALNLLNPLHRD